jgi:hypothetical protein
MSQSSPSSAGSKSPLLSSSTYDVLKHVAQMGLPFLAALYFALGQIWHLPDVAQVMATTAAVNTVLGILLGYSTVTYNNSEQKYAGIIRVVEDEAKMVGELVFHEDPQNVLGQKEAVFQIQPVSPPDSSTTNGSVAHGASIPPPGTFDN